MQQEAGVRGRGHKLATCALWTVMDREDLGLDGIGAFVDTEGSGKGLEGDRFGEGPALSRTPARGEPGDVLRDQIEDRLKDLLFGKQPFLPPQPSNSRSLDSDEDVDSDDELTEGGGDIRRSCREHRRSELERKPAWEDEDDAKISVDIAAHPRMRKLKVSADETVVSGTTYSKRLRSQYERLRGQPEWARGLPRKKKWKSGHGSGSDESSDDDDDEDEEDSLLRRTGSLLKGPGEQLPRGILDIKRMKDANSSKRAEAVVRAVEFHPSSSVVLVAGFHKTLDLFQVDGQTNPKLQSVHIQGFPISSAHFTQDGREVVMSTRRKKFFVYDMMAGKITPVYGIRGRDERFWDKFVVSPDNEYLVFLGRDGYMVLVSNKTKQWVGELKMNGEVKDVAFTSDSRYMLSIGSEGRVYMWDMSVRQCVHCFVDEGCIHGTRVAVSPDGQYVACGSDSGVVNLYRGPQCLSAACPLNPKPMKAVMNLTTGIDFIRFSPTSELMVMASQRKKKALKVVHLASQTVFSNWPVRKTPLSYVSGVDISPQSKYLAIGNDKGRVLLYRFNHFSQ